MNFAVLGGDGRGVCLTRLLLRDGHRVRTYAMERAEGLAPCHCETPEEALEGADCVVLPVPISTVPGLLNAPFGREETPLTEILPRLPAGVPVFAGAVKPEHTAMAGAGLTDLLAIEELAVKNAALTAEGAVGVLIRETERCLMGEHILILGAGRIGKLLGIRLWALGANVTVAARKDSDLAWCRALNLGGTDFGTLERVLPEYSCVVNTVPSTVLSGERLAVLPRGALVLELASKPGGVDPDEAKEYGVRVVNAGGLPGKTAPESAAEAILEVIYHNLQ